MDVCIQRRRTYKTRWPSNGRRNHHVTRNYALMDIEKDVTLGHYANLSKKKDLKSIS